MYQKFNISKEKYENEIDIVNILNSVRQLKAAFQVLLTQNQLKIIEFANYRNLTHKCETSKSIVNRVIDADK